MSNVSVFYNNQRYKSTVYRHLKKLHILYKANENICSILMRTDLNVQNAFFIYTHTFSSQTLTTSQESNLTKVLNVPLHGALLTRVHLPNFECLCKGVRTGKYF